MNFQELKHAMARGTIKRAEAIVALRSEVGIAAGVCENNGGAGARQWHSDAVALLRRELSRDAQDALPGMLSDPRLVDAHREGLTVLAEQALKAGNLAEGAAWIALLATGKGKK